MKDRLIGLDINGWQDFAFRNWRLDRDGMEQVVPEGHLIDGGPVSRVVFVGDEGKTPVGGPRAQLAMHGRGAGWGDFGKEERRQLIRKTASTEAWSACMKELGSEARIAVLAVPDLPKMNEAAREDRLDAMRGIHARRSMLVWSSVALALHQCQKMKVEHGHRLGIIEIEADGLRLQTLDIVERDALLTPRRRSVGRLIKSRMALKTREQAALKGICAAAEDARIARALRLADLPALLAMSGPGRTRSELLRLENGDWFEATGKAPDLHLDADFEGFLDAVDRVVLHGPCEQDLLGEAGCMLKNLVRKPVEVLSPSAVAYGSFLVAVRIRQGFPPWFDYLPNVETIVQTDEEVESLSLVEPDEVAEAGKVWQSRRPVKLRWQAKSKSMEVWLKKEDDPHPRFSPANVQDAPSRDQEVQLFLEQQPAQGRAKLRITSETWPSLRDRPAIVDWEAGKHDPDGRDWETIIADFKVRPPVVPERVVLPAHRELWYPDQGQGLADALREFDGRNYTPVYKALSARRQVYFDQPNHPSHYRVFYAIDSDGHRPPDVENADWELLLQVLAQAEADFTSGRVTNNHALGVLSWCFRLCPQSVWPIVIHVLKQQGGLPSFQGWRIMYPQALGRIASGNKAFKAAIAYLNSLEVPWTRDQQACAGFLLSRNDNIFHILEPNTIKAWARSAETSLNERITDGFSQRHYYLPILIAGLLRWRLREPNAFTLDHDPLAETFSDLLENTIRLPDIAIKEKAAFGAVRNSIHDRGARPDLLQTLFDLL